MGADAGVMQCACQQSGERRAAASWNPWMVDIEEGIVGTHGLDVDDRAVMAKMKSICRRVFDSARVLLLLDTGEPRRVSASPRNSLFAEIG